MPAGRAAGGDRTVSCSGKCPPAADIGGLHDVEGDPIMADLAFIALTVVFFAALALVARKLDRS